MKQKKKTQIQQIKLKRKRLIKEKQVNTELRIIPKIRNKIDSIIKALSGPALVMIIFVLFISALIFVKFYAETDPIIPVKGDNLANLMLITFVILIPLQVSMMMVNDGEAWGISF